MKKVQIIPVQAYFDRPDCEEKDLMFCRNGKEQSIVICSSELKRTLRSLSKSDARPTLHAVKKYLDENHIEYTEETI